MLVKSRTYVSLKIYHFTINLIRLLAAALFFLYALLQSKSKNVTKNLYFVFTFQETSSVYKTEMKYKVLVIQYGNHTKNGDCYSNNTNSNK